MTGAYGHTPLAHHVMSRPTAATTAAAVGEKNHGPQIKSTFTCRLFKTYHYLCAQTSCSQAIGNGHIALAPASSQHIPIYNNNLKNFYHMKSSLLMTSALFALAVSASAQIQLLYLDEYGRDVIDRNKKLY